MTLDRNKILLAITVILLLPLSVSAHTGVGSQNGFISGFGHPLGGLDHLLAMVAVGLWAAQLGGRSAWAVPVSFVALMMGAGILGLSGFYLPYIETGILVSILVLGAMIAGDVRLSALAGSCVVGLFAVFHGHAHGAEMPLAAGAVAYTCGFAAATLLLHLAGIGLGCGLRKLAVARIQRLAGGLIAFSGICLAVF